MLEALVITVVGATVPAGAAALCAFVVVGAVALAGRVRGRR
jgi:hypothetical protein